VFRRIAASAITLLVFAACTDEPVTTEPQATSAVPVVRSEVTSSSVPSGTSSVCAVNRRTLAALDGQLQDNPNDENLKADHAVQAAITADVCD
jgi:hypothetical protein